MGNRSKTKSKGIVSWPQDERPRERLLSRGANALTDAELIAILLRVGVQGKNAVELARSLLNRFGSLQAMMNSPLSDWKGNKGLGTAKVAQLQAALELGRRAALPNVRERTYMKGTQQAAEYFIDPPFATKQEFNGIEEQKAYQDKIAGALFLEFLRRRLVIMRELLADDGHILVHTDYRKGQYIKALLDEIFGEHNFRNEIIFPGRASKNLQQQFREISRLNVRHDNLFWYSANQKSKVSPLWVEKHDKGNPEGHCHHFWSTADRPTMRYKLFGFKPETGQWVWEEERAKQAVANYQRFLKESGGRTLAEYWRDTGSGEAPTTASLSTGEHRQKIELRTPCGQVFPFTVTRLSTRPRKMKNSCPKSSNS